MYNELDEVADALTDLINRAKDRVTVDDVNLWLGDEVTKIDLMELLADIANGVYTAKQLLEDIWESAA